jgi:hypothetical protein
MKTIIRIPENISLYLFADDKPVSIGSETIVGEPVELIIADCNSNNSEMIGNVTPPEDWIGAKYCFDGANWTLNPDYQPPRPLPEQE